MAGIFPVQKKKIILIKFCYPPLSDSGFSMGPAVDLSILSQHIAGISSLQGEDYCPTLIFMSLLPFNSPKIRYFNRVVPHNITILSIIFGSLLGDSYAERTKYSTRIILQQEDSNKEYLKWFHKTIQKEGYARLEKPTKEKRIGKNNKIRYFYRVRTFAFSSFNWIHNEFYPNDIKIIPFFYF